LRVRTEPAARVPDGHRPGPAARPLRLRGDGRWRDEADLRARRRAVRRSRHLHGRRGPEDDGRRGQNARQPEANPGVLAPQRFFLGTSYFAAYGSCFFFEPPACSRWPFGSKYRAKSASGPKMIPRIPQVRPRRPNFGAVSYAVTAQKTQTKAPRRRKPVPTSVGVSMGGCYGTRAGPRKGADTTARFRSRTARRTGPVCGR